MSATFETPTMKDIASCSSASRPRYVIFAGVNGAGKSTLYRSGLWKKSPHDNTLLRVNPDEILKAAGDDPASMKAQISAGKRALQLVDSYLQHQRPFSQETTLTGKLAVSRLKRIRELGYEICMHYVGLKDANLAIERIKHRASIGGHDIAETDVRRRFGASIANFSKALDYCDEVRVYDNTHELTRIAAWSHGTLCWWCGSPAKGAWLLQAMQSDNWRE